MTAPEETILEKLKRLNLKWAAYKADVQAASEELAKLDKKAHKARLELEFLVFDHLLQNVLPKEGWTLHDSAVTFDGLQDRIWHLKIFDVITDEVKELVASTDDIGLPFVFLNTRPDADSVSKLGVIYPRDEVALVGDLKSLEDLAEHYGITYSIKEEQS